MEQIAFMLLHAIPPSSCIGEYRIQTVHDRKLLYEKRMCYVAKESTSGAVDRSGLTEHAPSRNAQEEKRRQALDAIIRGDLLV